MEQAWNLGFWSSIAIFYFSREMIELIYSHIIFTWRISIRGNITNTEAVLKYYKPHYENKQA